MMEDVSPPNTDRIGECFAEYGGLGMTSTILSPAQRGRKNEIQQCSVESCSSGPRRRGMCDMHYRRWVRNGDPNVVRSHRGLSDQERFWKHVNKSGNCWEWQSEQVKGYGRFKLSSGKRIMAHRFAYEQEVAPIPPNLTIDHICVNGKCVRPSHLQVVTQAENNRLRNARRIDGK